MLNKKIIFFKHVKTGDMSINNLYAKDTKFNDVLEKVNINPLKSLPNPIIRLYGFSGIYGSIYFETEQELIDYAKNHDVNYGVFCILDYLGSVAGKHDVIRKTYEDGYFKLYTKNDDTSYLAYNYEKSYCTGKFIWDRIDGNLNEEYNALMKYSDNSLSKILMKKIN